jgi:hypothetical protein
VEGEQGGKEEEQHTQRKILPSSSKNVAERERKRERRKGRRDPLRSHRS